MLAVQCVGPVENPLRVILAEDDVLLREGLASLLERADFDVVGQADDGAQLVALVRQHTPDLVVTDIRMPPTNTTEGLDATSAFAVAAKGGPEAAEAFKSIRIRLSRAARAFDHLLAALSNPLDGKRREDVAEACR